MATNTQQTTTAADAGFLTGHWPALKKIGLSAADLNCLKSQGYLECVRRRQGQAGYFRIRFRAGGVLRAVYVGTETGLVAQVRHELAQLQSPRRSSRQLRKQARQGGRLLRELKHRIEPVLHTVGLHFHGDNLRETRQLQSERNNNKGAKR